MTKQKLTFTQKKPKILIHRVRLAMKNEFYLETAWLVSLTMESRLRSLIARNDQMHPGAGFTLEQCLKRMKFLLLKFNDPLLTKHITTKLIDDLRSWKNQRNLLFKAVESAHVSKKRLQNLAEEGIELMDRLNCAYKKYKAEWSGALVGIPPRNEEEI